LRLDRDARLETEDLEE